VHDAEQRKDAVLLGHRASCRSCHRGQHVDREALVSAFPVGAFLRSTAWASGSTAPLRTSPTADS
jgi:hypothetical protein